MTEVKICGVCSAADAALAAAAGADYIGVILAPGRTRSRTVAEAAAIFAAAGSARRVGVFVNAPASEMSAAASALGLDVVQLHGDEAPDVAGALRAAGAARIWKAVHVREPSDVERAAEQFAGAVDALLLEGWSAQGRGGVGATFEWEPIAHVRARLPRTLQIVAAGGLDDANVARAVAVLKPDVVDVSSGVERELGRKSAEKVKHFIAAARGAAGA